MQKHICVIGAGISGLCTIKELIEQNLNVTCYEQSETLGGAFNSVYNGGKVYPDMTLTVSNYFMAYSAFPPRIVERRDYWSSFQYSCYIDEYVRQFELYDHILFNHKVKRVNTSGDKALVEVENNEGQRETYEYDYVVVCSGANVRPNMPELPGHKSFSGDILHSKDFDKHDYTGKRVLCIGLGETGSDVSHYIAQRAEHCCVAVRSLPSVVPRYEYGQTNDSTTSRVLAYSGKFGADKWMKLQAYLKLKLGKRYSAKERFYFQMLLDQQEGFSDRLLTKNDVFIDDIVEGKLSMNVTEVASIDGNQVTFSDGSSEPFDFIVCNTGYQSDFSYIDQGALLQNPRDSLKHMLHPTLQDKLAMVGWARPTQGGVPAASEMQARYLALLLAGKKPWLQPAKAQRIIASDRVYEEGFFKGNLWLTSLVDYHRHMSSMAKLIGCQPKLSFLLHPTLSLRYWYGSHLSYFYRLRGPGAQSEKVLGVILTLPVAQTFRRNFVLTLLSVVNLVMKVSQKVKGLWATKRDEAGASNGLNKA